MKKFLFFITTFIIFCSCNEPKGNLRDYYYPKSDQETVYHFQSVKNDSMPPYSISFLTKGDELITTRFDFDNKKEQIVTEQFLKDGTTCKKYELIFYDSLGKMKNVNAAINSNASIFFAFDADKNAGTLPFEISFINPLDTLEKNFVTRSRLFVGFKEMEVFGKKYETAEFVTKTRARSDHKRDGSIAPEFVTREFYAKGKGLVFTKTDYNGKIVEYGLKE